MQDLTKGSPGKLIALFTIPILIGNVLQLFYNLVDTRIIGSILGTQALAAVGATSTMYNLIIGLIIGMTNGFAILTARDFGAKDEEAMKKDIAGTLVLGVAITIVLTMMSIYFLPDILTLLNMPEALMPEGMAYIRMILLGMIITMLYNVCASTLRALGDTVSPLFFLGISVICNIGLDFLFIRTFDRGVEGAALATVISQLLSVVLCLIYIQKRYPHLALKRADFSVGLKRYYELLTTGLSMGLMQSLVALGTVCLQGAINTFGTFTIVAHTAARKITELFMLPFSAFGMTMATYCGQNMGAGKMGRVREGVKKVILISWGWCLLVLIASYTVAPYLIQLVTATEVKEIIDTAVLYLRVDTLFYCIPALICILRNALQGLGDKVIPIFSSFIELFGKVLVVMFLTPHMQYMGIILAEPIVWSLMVIPLIIRAWYLLKRNIGLTQEQKISLE